MEVVAKAMKLLLVSTVVVAIAAGVALASDGGNGDPAPKPSAASEVVAAMTATDLVGQRIVTGYVGTAPPRYVLRAVRAGRVGGVILFTNNMPTPASAKRAIDKLQRWAAAGGRPRLLVMIDQEGGIVQRLAQLPPTRTPASMGRTSDPARTATAQGLATGRALTRLGFNVNLAPVVDVPRVSNSFLGNRAYSRRAKVAAAAGCGFADGNERGGVAATFKHFPGLGRAGADTDFSDVTIDAGRAQVDVENAAYRSCPETPTLVMMASARYPRLGIDRPASLERKTYAMLAETGFKGLTITDALETPQYGPSANTARSALAAGVDLLLWGQAWGRAVDARARLLGDVRAGRVTRAELIAGTERIVALKDRFKN